VTAPEPVTIDRCPLCGSTAATEHSTPEANLYSEKLAELLGRDERQVLSEHANWRCSDCGLVFKRRWFAPDVIRELFLTAVAAHPRGWDTVLDRFSAAGFQRTIEFWATAVDRQAAPDVRRGERELLSIVDSITAPAGYEPAAVAAAVGRGEVATLRELAPAITASIGEPAAFKRFAGFRSRALWDYLQARTGGFAGYAEVGCPLWGLLPLAADSGCRATFLVRDEPNYWGPGCTNAGVHCLERLLSDRRIAAAPWSAPDRQPVIGLFQYLDHLTAPGRFLEELFARADSAAIIMDGIGDPVAIQHVTGWTDESFAFIARAFGKRLHDDFDAIRPSGNRLFLLTPDR
jgi:hypothetical protein